MVPSVVRDDAVYHTNDMAAISITTKTGDSGTSGLANGERLPKNSPVFEVIGTLDELNSWIGLIVAQLSKTTDKKLKKEREFLLTIQDTLFYIGAEVAQSPKAQLKPTQLKQIEKHADALQAVMADGWHTKFLLPGGTQLGAQIDITRTVCRRCERCLVQLIIAGNKLPLIQKYLNRLSDYLYLLRCFVNQLSHQTEREFTAS